MKLGLSFPDGSTFLLSAVFSRLKVQQSKWAFAFNCMLSVSCFGICLLLPFSVRCVQLLKEHNSSEILSYPEVNLRLHNRPSPRRVIYSAKNALGSSVVKPRDGCIFCSTAHLRPSHSQFVIDPTRSRIFAPFWHSPRLEMQSRPSSHLYHLPHKQADASALRPRSTPALVSKCRRSWSPRVLLIKYSESHLAIRPKFDIPGQFL